MEKKESILTQCEDIVRDYLRELSEKKGQLNIEEARFVTDVAEQARRVRIVKLGDPKSGFYPTKKAYDKMLSILRKAPEGLYGHTIVWDNLVESEKLEDSEVPMEDVEVVENED